MRRTRGQLIQKGRERWLVRIFVGRDGDGRRKYTSKLVAGTKTDARDELDKMLADRANGRLVTTQTRLTVGEWADQWLDTVVRPSCRARTHHDYTSILDRYVRPRLGSTPVRRLTATNVRLWIATLREAKLSPRTVRMAHEVLRNLLSAAVQDGMIPGNPARSELVKKSLPAKQRNDRRTIDASKLAAFLEVVQDDPLGAYWLTLLFGGLRPSEALALRWRDVDGDTIRITRVLVDKPGLPLHYEQPKSKTSRRAVAVPSLVTNALKEHRKRQLEDRLKAGAKWNDEDLIFARRDGSQLRQSMTRETWRRLLEAGELPSMRVYDLRHSCASLLLAAGENVKTISERLGHSSVTLTLDTYSHAAVNAQRDAAARLDRLASAK